MLNRLVPLALACIACAQLPAQEPAQSSAQPGAAAAARPGERSGKRVPLFFREAWKTVKGEQNLTSDMVSSPNLELKTYGPAAAQLQALGNADDPSNPPHIWTGLCATSCALTLSNKDNFVDLTGKAKIRWYTKTSGFHEVRPVLKLADGTLLVGDHVDANTADYLESEFYVSQVHWLKLDAPTVQTKGTLLDKVDLSKVDAIGFADLTPGSGHGTGGYSDVAWIEVYGKPVKRDTPSQSN